MKRWLCSLSVKQRKVLVLLIIMCIIFFPLFAMRISYEVNLREKARLYPQKEIAKCVSICVAHEDSITWFNTVTTNSKMSRKIQYTYKDITYIFTIPDEDMSFWKSGMLGYTTGEKLVVQFNPARPREVVLSQWNNKVYTAEVYVETT